MSPTLLPANYQPAPASPGAAVPSAPPPASSTPRQRVRTLLIGAGIAAAVWLAANLFAPFGTLGYLTIGMSVAAGLLWTLYAVLTSVDERFFPRFLLTGWTLIVVWAAIAALGAFAFVGGVAPLLIGWAGVAVVLVLMLILPIWVIELHPGEVLYHRASYHRETTYDLIACPLTPATPRRVMMFRGRSASSTPDPIVVAASDPNAAIARIDLEMGYEWIRPLDELRMIWRLNQVISVEKTIQDLRTRDQSLFTLWLKLSFRHDPTKIAAMGVKMRIPYLHSPAELEQLLRGPINDNMEKVARDFFIELPIDQARGREGLLGIRAQINERLKTVQTNFGLTLVEDMTQSREIVSDQQRHEAEAAAAAIDQRRSLENKYGIDPHDRSELQRAAAIEKSEGLRALPQFNTSPNTDNVPQFVKDPDFLRRVEADDPIAIDLMGNTLAQRPDLINILPASVVMKLYSAGRSGMTGATPPPTALPTPSTPTPLPPPNLPIPPANLPPAPMSATPPPLDLDAPPAPRFPTRPRRDPTIDYGQVIRARQRGDGSFGFPDDDDNNAPGDRS